MLLAKETIYIHDWWLSPGDLFSLLFEFSDADWLIFPSDPPPSILTCCRWIDFPKLFRETTSIYRIADAPS